MQADLQKEFLRHYEMHKDMVFRIAMTYVKNVEDAKDIVQDTFIRLDSCQKRFENEEHCKRWLIRVAINLAKDHLRSFWSSRRDGSEGAMRQLYEVPAVDNKDSELLMEVFSLPSKYKAVIYLHYYEGYAYHEIAKILRISLSCVKMRARRGRELLRIELSGAGEYLGRQNI